MKGTVFPSSIIEQSSDQIFREESRLSGLLYIFVLVFIIACLTATFFIKINVSIRAGGIIKPKEDRTIIAAPASGYMSAIKLDLNSEVNIGDTLLIIQSDVITAKLPMLRKRKDELTALIHDLKYLTSGNPDKVKLQSPMYRQDVLYYIARREEAEAKIKQTKATYERSKKLFEANVIPLSDFEPAELEYTQAENALKTLDGYQKRQWESDLVGYVTEINEVEAQISQIETQDAETIVVSPTKGTIQQVMTMFDGVYITAGQNILEISPNGHLIAECYIEPKDIGYFRKGMVGLIQISAFNYNDWGMLKGTVEEIFNDVTVSSDGTNSFYKVFCSLDSDHLTLKNGYKGYIKKGMTLSSNFIITRRTIFQLLYDKIDNWLNPSTSSIYE